MSDLSERARGRWTEILPLLGVDRRYLSNRHGPCPLCGGKDRFRFDNKRGDGTYICNQCGAGNGFTMLRKLHKWDSVEAGEQVAKIVGDWQRSRFVAEPDTDSAINRRGAIERLLESCTDDAVVETYLRRRGLSVTSPVLLGHAALPYYDRGQLKGRYPAVVAPILGADGSLQSAHRIYDADLVERKKMMPKVQSVKGAAVRLFPAAGDLAVAEGIETAMAVHELFGLPVWATLHAHNMEIFTPPANVERLWIYGDNDESMTGQAAAYALAKRMVSAGIVARVEIPSRTGSDWLDELTG